LSGGEQQRVAIAVVLVHELSPLLADESTGETDSVTTQAVFEALRRINEAYGLTTIVVTHDPRIAG